MKKGLTILLLLITEICCGQASIITIPTNDSAIINHTLTYKPRLLFNEQSTLHIDGSGVVNQAFTPAACGAWYDQGDNTTCFVGWKSQFTVNDTNFLFPYKLTVDLQANYTLSDVYVFVTTDEPAFSQRNTLKFTAGTPFVWEDNIGTLTNVGPATWGQWVRITVALGHTTRFIHIEGDQHFPTIREIVFRGTYSSPIAAPASYTAINPSPYKRNGTNMTYRDGFGYDYISTSTPVDYSANFPIQRVFSYATAYFNEEDGSLLDPAGLGGLESITSDLQYDRGINHFYAWAAPAIPNMFDPAIPGTYPYNDRKPINYSYQSYGAGTRFYNGKPIFDNVADQVFAYGQVAWNVTQFVTAVGSRPKPHTWFEIMNEHDGGAFMGAAFMFPDQMAAFMSMCYDGHMGTQTYLGHALGVKNSGVDVKLMMPALANFSKDYWMALQFWFRWNRTDPAYVMFPADGLNQHLYSNLLVAQDFGAAGVAVQPDDTNFGMESILDWLYDFRNHYAPHAIVANTESGFDAYEEINSIVPCLHPYGNLSFVHIPPIDGQTIEETQGYWIARLMLLHMRSKFDWFLQYWMADRGKLGTNCGTFQQAGTLAIMNIDGSFNLFFRKRPAFYFYQQVDSITQGYNFISQTLYTNDDQDSVKIQKYQLQDHANEVMYALYSPTGKNATVSDFHLTFAHSGDYTVYPLTDNVTVPTASDFGSGSGLTMDVTERVVFVRVVENNAGSIFSDRSKSRRKYKN